MSRQFPGTDSVCFIVRNTQQRILISRAKVGAAGRVQEVAAREAGSLVAQRCMQIPETEVAAVALCRPTEKLFTLSVFHPTICKMSNCEARAAKTNRTNHLRDLCDLENKTYSPLTISN